MALNIPQADPRANFLAHRAEIETAIAEVLVSGSYILGRQVAAFEQEFASYLGASYGIGISSGTDALHVALRACRIGPGDTVITVSHTAVATVAAIELAGAAPALVDVDPKTFTLDPECLESVLRLEAGRRPRAVIPVHLYGHPADMPAIMDIARRFGLLVIEDCAQSHGAVIQGKKVGTWGDIAAFSFYPTKNLGALGDAGIVITSEPELADRARILREYGWRERYVSEAPGMNTRLDEVQAAVLRVKLRYLEAENAKRRQLAGFYQTALGQSALILPVEQQGCFHVYHQYVVRSQRRDALRTYLRGEGIGTLVHYPVPIHRQPAYQGRVRAHSMDRTEDLVRQLLSLPMFPELTDEHAAAVATTILRWSCAEIG